MGAAAYINNRKKTVNIVKQHPFSRCQGLIHPGISNLGVLLLTLIHESDGVLFQQLIEKLCKNLTQLKSLTITINLFLQ